MVPLLHLWNINVYRVSPANDIAVAKLSGLDKAITISLDRDPRKAADNDVCGLSLYMP